jgi:uncharacterized protein (TIGR02594 family)
MHEGRDQAALMDFLENGGQNLDPATTAWCAAAVNAALEQSGIKGTGSNMAQSFMDWGQPVDQPQQGDLAVFDRGGGKGHVGFFEGYNPDGTLRILGGNQSDKVSVSSFGTDNLLGFRRPENAMAGMGQGTDFNPNANAMAQFQEPPLPPLDAGGINLGLAMQYGQRRTA